MAVAGLGLAAPPPGRAGDREVARAVRSHYPAAELAAARATDPEGFQRLYDRARDLQEAVRAGAPAGAACRPLAAALGRYAAGRILEMEGVDRPSVGDRAAGARRARAARGAIARASPSCRGGGRGRPVRRLAVSPADGEASFGAVVARAPTGATSATLAISGGPPRVAPVRGGRARFAVQGTGRADLTIAFLRGATRIGTARSRAVWLLPASARRAAPGTRSDPTLAARLADALSRGPAYRAAWVHDLTSGAVAGANARAAFPAASTVRLGLLAGALARLGAAAPERSRLGYDLRAMVAWSSNLATNRLLRRLGTGAATDGLRRLGARRSTFPGEYIVGTQLGPPPRVSRRVTTAEDLGRMLFALHATAAGAPGARARTGLTVHQARLGLGWLLSSQQRGENRSLLAGGAGGGPIAQKNGWIRSARHGAGIVYGPGGPAIAVVMTYDPAGVGVTEARALGARVARAALRP